MRLVSFDTGAGPRAALLRDGRVYDIWGEAFRPRDDDCTVYALLQGGLITHVEPVEDEGVPVEGVPLLPPIARPNKIVCIGLNYRSHAQEQGAEPPETPTFFAKYANALAAPGATVALPSWSEKVDYEAEVAFVIGSRCKDASEERAMDHVAGYMLLNDLSARDYQFKSRSGCPARPSTAPPPAARRWSRRTRPAPTTRSRSS